VWDGGNNDFPFIRPDLLIVVVDPLRPGHGLAYHPGETNLRMADVVLVNKLGSASEEQVTEQMAVVQSVNPDAAVVRADSVVTLGPGPPLAGKSVLVIEDGPSVTHGGMAWGAGTVAARDGGAAALIDPRPWAAGSIARTMEQYPHLGPVLPAMGYSDQQLRELEQTVNAADCDLVVAGTPVDLERLIDSRHPIRQVRYELRERGEPDLAQVLAPIVVRAGGGS
jgi:predicted GTPase